MIVRKRIELLVFSKKYENLEYQVVTNILQAKRTLTALQFDLLILDLNLPFEESDAITEENGGYLLYKEILRSDMLKKPNHIVMLSSYPNLVDKYKESVEKGNFRLVHYDVMSTHWSTEILSRVEYIIQHKRDTMKSELEKYNYYTAIITAVEVEFKACMEIINVEKEYKLENDSTHYYVGNLKTDPSKTVVVVKQLQKGLTAAGVLSTKLIKNFRPKYLVMLGICGGVKNAVELGDVILATEVVEFTSGKLTNDIQLEKMFKPEPRYLSVGAEIKEVINKDFSSDISDITSKYNYKERELKGFTVINGPVVSGPFVLQNETVIDTFIIPYNRDVRGIDMEAYGVLYAAEHSYLPKPKVIICKAVSDFADEYKNNTYQLNASLNSVYIAECLLTKYLN